MNATNSLENTIKLYRSSCTFQLKTVETTQEFVMCIIIESRNNVGHLIDLFRYPTQAVLSMGKQTNCDQKRLQTVYLLTFIVLMFSQVFI